MKAVTGADPDAASAANVGLSASFMNSFNSPDVSQCAMSFQSPRRSSMICWSGVPLVPVTPRCLRVASFCSHTSWRVRRCEAACGFDSTSDCNHTSSVRCCVGGSEVTALSISRRVLIIRVCHYGEEVTSKVCAILRTAGEVGRSRSSKWRWSNPAQKRAQWGRRFATP